MKTARQSSWQDQDIDRPRASRTACFPATGRLDSNISSAAALEIAFGIKAVFWATAAGTSRLIIATFTTSITPRHKRMMAHIQSKKRNDLLSIVYHGSTGGIRP
jgi:hypothetical protein